MIGSIPERPRRGGLDAHGRVHPRVREALPRGLRVDVGHGPRFSLVSAMTDLMACGLALEDIVPMATSSAARMLALEGQVGTLRPGATADVSVLHDGGGAWTLRDGEGHDVRATRRLRPAFCLRAGQRVEADAPILPVA